MLFIEYPVCSTCKRAKAFLEKHHLSFEDRNIKEDVPTAEELKKWQSLSQKDLKSFYNTSGQIYRNENIKEKRAHMTEEEQLALLASQGMLIKRPILVVEDRVLIGFKEPEWEALLREKNLIP